MTIAKSIAAGIPLRVSSGERRSWTRRETGAVGGTYVGNPVAIAAAHAVLDTIAEDRLVDRAVEVGETIRARMESWRDRFDSVAEVRGLGAMLAIELRQNGEPARRPRPPRSPTPPRATAFSSSRPGIHGNCIRVLVPL